MKGIYEKVLEKYIENVDEANGSTKSKVIQEKFVDVIMNNDSILNKVLKKNPRYSTEHLEQKLVRMGLAQNEDEAKYLAKDALSKNYPQNHRSDDYKFEQILTKKGKLLYKMVHVDYGW